MEKPIAIIPAEPGWFVLRQGCVEDRKPERIAIVAWAIRFEPLDTGEPNDGYMRSEPIVGGPCGDDEEISRTCILLDPYGRMFSYDCVFENEAQVLADFEETERLRQKYEVEAARKVKK